MLGAQGPIQRFCCISTQEFSCEALQRHFVISGLSNVSKLLFLVKIHAGLYARLQIPAHDLIQVKIDLCAVV